MARPVKQGLDYFPLDVDQDQDDKLGMIIGEFQSKGELFWIKLLSFIYENKGYYSEWGEDAQLRFLRRYNYCGFSVSFINEVVPRLIKWELLDQVVFNSFHLLTSVRIQETWYDATRKRKDRIYRPEIWLLRVNDGLRAEETELMTEETTQKKEKNNKRNEKRESTAVSFGTTSNRILEHPQVYGSSILKSVESLMTDCLADKVYFVDHIRRKYTISEIQLTSALGAFNAYLLSIGEGLKGVKDYRSHFQNWLGKQDLKAFRIGSKTNTGTVDETLKQLGI